MKTKKFLAVLISGILMAALLSGCGTNKGGDNSAANTAGTNSEAKLSGTIKMAGSTSMEKLARKPQGVRHSRIYWFFCRN